MQGNFVETLIGAVVIAVAAAFLFFAYSSVGAGNVQGYVVKARFDHADGISVGTDVRMSGIKIGTVTSLVLDTSTYLATVEMNVMDSVKLPEDSSVKITSEGLLGGSYLSIEPGGAEELIASGGEITNTQGALDLVGLLGRAVFGAGDKEEKPAPSNEPAPAPSGEPAPQGNGP